MPAWYGSASVDWEQALAVRKTLSTVVLALLSSIYSLWVFGWVSSNLSPFLYSSAPKEVRIKFSVKYHSAFGGRIKGLSIKSFYRNFMMKYIFSFFTLQSCWGVNTRLYGFFQLGKNPTSGSPHWDETNRNGGARLH